MSVRTRTTEGADSREEALANIDEAVRLLEETEWSVVPGVSVAEAATIASRLQDAADELEGGR